MNTAKPNKKLQEVFKIIDDAQRKADQEQTNLSIDVKGMLKPAKPMGKQLTFTKKETNDIGHAVAKVADILFRKMAEGVNEPILEGHFEVANDDKFIEFSFNTGRK